MPIQITELNISVSVHQPGNQNSDQAAQATPAPAKREDVVEQCVDQIIKIINDKKER